tara:strand:+ start:363 stop:575 length:213 start_codon:yes stop_codon:yes gene_type:complete
MVKRTIKRWIRARKAEIYMLKTLWNCSPVDAKYILLLEYFDLLLFNNNQLRIRFHQEADFQICMLDRWVG